MVADKVTALGISSYALSEFGDVTSVASLF